ncbi:hypothetical protein [Vreelandella alkaliphila]|uniref:Uncharacterized protein n=1 Tax=Vreelandella alkaliphila TaxID=272774 RepID=A0AAJ2S595_9GAMM|nr:hypothetical protein [Halomonas alkaliphila]MDX5979625.1 hypothetical protein [Halomonas alkaliphila]
MTQVKDQSTANYSNSSLQILRPLEPIKVRSIAFDDCVNPVLHCEESVEALQAILAFEDVLLMSFRHYKVQLAVMMRRLRRYSHSLAWRADMVLRAIHTLSRSTGLMCNEALYKCKRFLMLTAQHDDARLACPAAGLSAI